MQPCKMKPDWDKHKVAIFHLYQKEKKPLRDVMHIMVQRYSFVASLVLLYRENNLSLLTVPRIKQYKDQFKKWEMVKNLNKVDVAICLYALDDIERENRQQVVLLRGRVVTRGDINTYLKKTKKREENLRATIPRPTEWPPHIVFRSSQLQMQTPPSSRGNNMLGSGLSPTQPPEQATPYTTTSPWNVSSSPTKLLTPRSSLSQRTSFSSRNVADSGFASEAEEDENPVEHIRHDPLDKDVPMEEVDFLEEDEVSDRDKAKICAGLADSDNFGQMVRQTIAPKPLSGFERANPLFFSLLSTSAPAIYRQDQDAVPAGQAQANESTFAKALYDRERLVRSYPIQMTRGAGNEAIVSVEPSVSFLRGCLSACIVGGQGFRETANALMHGAVQDFRNMVNRCDSYSLTVLNLLIALLESVGQRPLAETILRKILETESDQLESESPIGVTIRFLLDIVCDRARQSKYTADRMWQVYHGLCELWGADSPSALAGLYHVAWTLALVDDTDSRREAWAILEHLNVRCEVTLGPCHFQTITSMATSARVLYHLEEHWEAARLINRAIQRLDLMYEDFHPYRLEARSRQAKLLMKLEGSHDVETILQDVVRQQAAVLGVQNSRTQSTLALLKDFLIRKGRSQDAYKLPELLERISDNGFIEN